MTDTITFALPAAETAQAVPAVVPTPTPIIDPSELSPRQIEVIRLYVDAILKMDEGVEVSQVIDEATPHLGINDDRVDVIACDIMNHEVTDSK